MKLLACVSLALLLATGGVCAQSTDGKTEVHKSSPKKWVCEAEGLAEFRYSGDDWAYIRLSAYSRGHDYRVTKDATGDTAKGSTQDSTPFVCRNK